MTKKEKQTIIDKATQTYKMWHNFVECAETAETEALKDVYRKAADNYCEKWLAITDLASDLGIEID